MLDSESEIIYITTTELIRARLNKAFFMSFRSANRRRGIC